MLPVAKTHLEQICLQYLNHLGPAQPVEEVTLSRSPVGSANWTLAAIRPKIAIQDFRKAHAAIRELQQTFRMVT